MTMKSVSLLHQVQCQEMELDNGQQRIRSWPQGTFTLMGETVRCAHGFLWPSLEIKIRTDDSRGVWIEGCLRNGEETGGFPQNIPHAFLLVWWTRRPISLHTPLGQPEPVNIHAQGAVCRVPLDFLARIPQGGKKASRSKHFKTGGNWESSGHVAFKHF